MSHTGVMQSTDPEEPVRTGLGTDSPSATPELDPAWLAEVQQELDDAISSQIPQADTTTDLGAAEIHGGVGSAQGVVGSGPIDYLDSGSEPTRTGADRRPEDFDG